MLVLKIIGIIAICIILIFIIFWLGVFIWVVLNDDVREIDNSDDSVICGDTGKPCIKSVLYTKYDNCSDCPYNTKNGGN